MDVMGVMGFASTVSAQSLQSVKTEAGVGMLSKAMDNEAQGMQALMDGMEQANAKAAELSVRPEVGSRFDMRI